MAVTTPPRAPGRAQPTWRAILVKLRDLDTDERQVLTRAGWEARGDQAIRSQLIEVVLDVRPEARIRSYHGGVASFVDREYLIIARYGDRLPPPEGERAPGSDSEQQALFRDAA